MSAHFEEPGGTTPVDAEAAVRRELGTARLVEARALFDDAFAFCAWLSGEQHPLDATVGFEVRADGPPRPSLGALAWTTCPVQPRERPVLLVASLWPITEEHLGALLVLLARAGEGRALVVAPAFGRNVLDVLQWMAAMASPNQQLGLVAVCCRFLSVDGSRPAPLLETVLDTTTRPSDERPLPEGFVQPSRSLEAPGTIERSAERAPSASLAASGTPSGARGPGGAADAVPEAPPAASARPEEPEPASTPAAPEPSSQPIGAMPSEPEVADGPAAALWTAFLAELRQDHPDWRLLERSETRCVLEPPGRDVVVAAEALPGFRLRASLVVGPPNRPDEAEARFGALERARARFEQTFGGALAWEALPLRGVFRISDYAAGDPSEVDEHADYVRFLSETAARLVLAYDSAIGGSPEAAPGPASGG